MEGEANRHGNKANRYGDGYEARSDRVNTVVLYFLSKNNISPFVHCCAIVGGRKEDAAVGDGSSEHKEEAIDTSAAQECIG